MTSNFSTKSIARVSTLALTVALGGVFGLVAHPQDAQAKTTVDQLEQQIEQLQGELQELRAQQSTAQQQAAQASQDAAAVAAAQAASKQAGDVVTYTKKNGLRLGKLNVKIGGFVAAEAVERSRAMASDMDDRFTGIPLSGNQSHEHEFRGSGRQSRLTLGITANPDAVTKLSAYFEGDFMGAANTSNSKATNSYVPRLRQAWAGYERSDWGLHIFAGQTWTLATSEKATLLPGNEAGPPVIDNSIAVGFTYLRQAGVRIVKDFGQKYWAALSLENPQIDNASGNNINAGTGNLTGVSVSNDTAPDVIAKVAADTSFGHFGVYGLARFFHNNATAGSGIQSQTEVAGGIGASAYSTVIPKKLDLQANVLWGNGTGRYGPSQLADVAVKPSGSLEAIRNLQLLAGGVGHITPALDVYAFGGLENAYSSNPGVKSTTSGGTTTFSATGFGAGSGSAHRTIEATIGAWWKFYQGTAGTMQVGAQYAWLREDNFSSISTTTGAIGASSPHGTDNVEMVSLRYFPFQ